ncbi:interleukin-13 [Pangasianodon hypophthalmus]|uniref:interleukin-13 n=1 Tax=Pangasianodon hypophthalmus TaxID=310915 RepID=UPI00147C2738|nr:interleukin-13 [Pangasianodon hypophthalmus]
MKVVVVFLATATALAYGTVDLKFIMREVKCLHEKTLNTEDFDSVFVKDLKENKKDSCEAEFFCLAEKVLSGVKKIPKGDGNCSTDKLLRYLKQYNNGTNCSVPKKGDEIILRSFLDDLLKCVKKVYSRS